MHMHTIAFVSFVIKFGGRLVTNVRQRSRSLLKFANIFFPLRIPFGVLNIFGLQL